MTVSEYIEKKEKALATLETMKYELSNQVASKYCRAKYEAIDMAIKALEQQPSDEIIKYLECNDIDVQKFTKDMKKQRLQAIKSNISEDCVSRQAVIEYIEACGAELGHDLENESVREDILNMPPVTPTFPKGATNGNMIKAMFPYIKIYEHEKTDICDAHIQIDIWDFTNYVSKDWWNAPYGEKRGNENG